MALLARVFSWNSVINGCSWIVQPDSTNELSELFLEISDAVARAADERAKAVVVRRLKRALEQQD